MSPAVLHRVVLRAIDRSQNPDHPPVGRSWDRSLPWSWSWHDYIVASKRLERDRW